jgi:chromate transporter
VKQKSAPSLTDLFLAFFWLGLTAFGGLAMTAQVRKYIVDKKQWLDEDTFNSGLALCQIIPGAVVMQLAAYIGLKLKGIRGSVVCFFGFLIPAFLIMFILSVLYKQAKDITAVELSLSGLRVLIVAIVANAVYIFGRKNFHTVSDWIIAAISAALFFTKIHPAVVLFIAALAGIVLYKKKDNGTSEFVSMKTFRFFLFALSLVIVSIGILFLIKKEYFSLVTTMLRIDLFSFGGGLAAIPIMYHEFVDLLSWFDKKTFMDGIVLGQVTPGSIIIAATFFGYIHFGIIGSLLATVFVFIPSFLILMGIIPFFDKLRSYPQFNKVINGILCAFVGLLAVVTYHFAIDIHWNFVRILFSIAALVLLMRKLDVIWIILGGVVLSLLHIL